MSQLAANYYKRVWARIAKKIVKWIETDEFFEVKTAIHNRYLWIETEPYLNSPMLSCLIRTCNTTMYQRKNTFDRCHIIISKVKYDFTGDKTFYGISCSNIKHRSSLLYQLLDLFKHKPIQINDVKNKQKISLELIEYLQPSELFINDLQTIKIDKLIAICKNITLSFDSAYRFSDIIKRSQNLNLHICYIPDRVIVYGRDFMFYMRELDSTNTVRLYCAFQTITWRELFDANICLKCAVQQFVLCQKTNKWIDKTVDITYRNTPENIRLVKYYRTMCAFNPNDFMHIRWFLDINEKFNLMMLKYSNTTLTNHSLSYPLIFNYISKFLRKN
jgi:hypothetical protein